MTESQMRNTLATAAMVFFATGSACRADDLGQSGQDLFRRYCASCHGVTGRGDGPVAQSLTIEVPDLTRFAHRHGGSFDRALVERIIDGRFLIGAHGTRTMPIWGEELSKARLGDPDAQRATNVLVLRLADYVWQLQRPAVGDLSSRPSK